MKYLIFCGSFFLHITFVLNICKPYIYVVKYIYKQKKIIQGSLSGHHPGGLQANARKTGDYESNCHEELGNRYLEEVQVCHFLPDLLQTGRCEEVDHAGNYQQQKTEVHSQVFQKASAQGWQKIRLHS